MSKTSPTRRSLAECRKRNWTVAIVEKWVPFPKPGHRVDLFGVIDLLALTPDGILGIQACAGASHAARVDKVLAEPRVAAWLGAGGKIAVWSWAKRGAKGKRKVWTLREQEVTV